MPALGEGWPKEVYDKRAQVNHLDLKEFYGDTDTARAAVTDLNWVHVLDILRDSRSLSTICLYYRPNINGCLCSRCSFYMLLRKANAIKAWANAIKMPDQHKYK